MRLLVLFLVLSAGLLADNIVVTGKPASVELIQTAVSNYLKCHYYTRLEPESAYPNDVYEYKIEPLQIGNWQLLEVPVWVDQKKKIIQTITLNIYNQPVLARPADYLLVSNEPEAVRKTGLLNSYTLNGQETMRLVYFHKNVANQRMILAIVAENPDSEKQKLMIIPGSGGPSKDGIYAGNTALKKFFRFWKDNAGYIEQLPEKQSQTILYQWFDPGQIVCGVLEFSLLGRGPVTIKVVAEDLEAFGIAGFLPTNAEDNKNRIGGIFSNPYKELNAEVDVDKLPATYRIGDEPFIVDAKTGRKLRGNYGLLYRYKLRLTNNNENVKMVQLRLVQSGGAARGVFIVNNILRETEIRKMTPFYTQLVPARGYLDLDIMTMPQPGSNYPVTMVLESAAAEGKPE